MYFGALERGKNEQTVEYLDEVYIVTPDTELTTYHMGYLWRQNVYISFFNQATNSELTRSWKWTWFMTFITNEWGALPQENIILITSKPLWNHRYTKKGSEYKSSSLGFSAQHEKRRKPPEVSSRE